MKKIAISILSLVLILTACGVTVPGTSQEMKGNNVVDFTNKVKEVMVSSNDIENNVSYRYTNEADKDGKTTVSYAEYSYNDQKGNYVNYSYVNGKIGKIVASDKYPIYEDYDSVKEYGDAIAEFSNKSYKESDIPKDRMFTQDQIVKNAENIQNDIIGDYKSIGKVQEVKYSDYSVSLKFDDKSHIFEVYPKNNMYFVRNDKKYTNVTYDTIPKEYSDLFSEKALNENKDK